MDTQIIKDYFKERKEPLYFLGGCGVGAFLGENLLWICLMIGGACLIYLQIKRKKA